LTAHFALRNTASNSAEKKAVPAFACRLWMGSSREGVAGGGGWGEEFRLARAEVRQQADKLRRFRRPALGGTSKQNNFQFLLIKIWRAGVKKLKENCFALLAEVRRAETRSGIIRAIVVQKRFELRSAIATYLYLCKQKLPQREFLIYLYFLICSIFFTHKIQFFASFSAGSRFKDFEKLKTRVNFFSKTMYFIAFKNLAYKRPPIL